MKWPLEFNAGTKLAKALRGLLKPNGILAATAYHYELFRRDHWGALGYDVLRTVDPTRLYTGEYPSIYVVRNNPEGQVNHKALIDYAGVTSGRFWSKVRHK